MSSTDASDGSLWTTPPPEPVEVSVRGMTAKITGAELTAEAIERVRKFMERRVAGLEQGPAIIELPPGANIEFVPMFVTEEQLDPELVGKVNVSMRLVVELARTLANVLQAIGEGPPLTVEVGMTMGGEPQRIVPNNDLREAAFAGRAMVGVLADSTKELPPEWRIVQCNGCRRLWLGSDVMSWHDLETRADFESAAPVVCCPVCNEELKDKALAQARTGG